MDMEVDIFAAQPFGKAALKQFGAVPENFRLFQAGWLGSRPEDFRVMEVKGAEFRRAQAGPNKGKLSIMVPGTVRSTHVTREEVLAFDTAAPKKRTS